MLRGFIAVMVGVAHGNAGDVGVWRGVSESESEGGGAGSAHSEVGVSEGGGAGSAHDEVVALVLVQ